MRYMVAEKLPDKSDAATWKRVIAVVVTGKPTQFKDYPFKVQTLHQSFIL